MEQSGKRARWWIESPVLRPNLYLTLLLTLFLFSRVVLGVSTADNAELQLVGSTLGLAHPPGFPLYTLLAHLVHHLPFSAESATKINALSAALSGIVLFFVGQSGQKSAEDRWLGLAAPLILITSTTFLSQAAIANIRTPTLLAYSVMIWALLHRRHGVAVLACALGITHHISLLFIGIVLLLYLLWQHRLHRPTWARFTLLGLCGALPLLYLPLRSAELRALTPFLRYALGLGFGGDFFYFHQLSTIAERLQIIGNLFLLQYPNWLWGLALLGVWPLWKRNRPITLFLLTSFSLHTLIIATYRAPQTIEYLIPTYIPPVLFATAALAWLASKIGRFAPLLPLLLLSWAAMRLYHTPSPSTTWRYDQTILQSAPANAVILSNWHWATPLWYQQQQQGLRPDVTVRYLYPRGEAYGETWRNEIEQWQKSNRPIFVTNYYRDSFASLPTPRPSTDGWLFSAEPLPPPTNPHRLGSFDLTIGSYQQTNQSIALDSDPIQLTITWLAPAEHPPFSLFAHLVGADGRLYAQDDHRQQADGKPQMAQFTLWPRLGSTPGTYQLLLGAYLADGTPLLSADLTPRKQFGTIQLLPAPHPPFTQNHNWWPWQGARGTLIGYDCDTTMSGRPRLYLHWRVSNGYVTESADTPLWQEGSKTIPCTTGHYVPLAHGIIWLGTTAHPHHDRLRIIHQFAASRPINRDYTISTHINNAQNDSIPAMGALPTLKWLTGWQISDPHTFSFPTEKSAELTLSLYDAFTQITLPILDERLAEQGQTIHIHIPLP